MSEQEYEVWPEYEEQDQHSATGFCFSDECACHSDDNQEAVNALGEYVQDGLASVDDAENIYYGRVVKPLSFMQGI